MITEATVLKTAADIKKNTDENGILKFVMWVSFNDLIGNTQGIEYLNDKVDDVVCSGEIAGMEDGLLEGMSYDIVGFDQKRDLVFVEVTGDTCSLVFEEQ